MIEENIYFPVTSTFSGPNVGIGKNIGCNVDPDRYKTPKMRP